MICFSKKKFSDRREASTHVCISAQSRLSVVVLQWRVTGAVSNLFSIGTMVFFLFRYCSTSLRSFDTWCVGGHLHVPFFLFSRSGATTRMSPVRRDTFARPMLSRVRCDGNLAQQFDVEISANCSCPSEERKRIFEHGVGLPTAGNFDFST